MSYKDLEKQRACNRLYAARIREQKKIAQGETIDPRIARRAIEFKQNCSDWQNNFVVLDEIEKTVLISFFGLDGNKPLSLRDIGKTLNFSHEYVRKIKDEALSKLGDLSRDDV